jgi:hypothetical protein
VWVQWAECRVWDGFSPAEPDLRFDDCRHSRVLKVRLLVRFPTALLPNSLPGGLIAQTTVLNSQLASRALS